MHGPLQAKAEDHGQVPRPLRRGLGRTARGAASPRSSARAVPAGHRAGAAQHRAGLRRRRRGTRSPPRSSGASPATWRCTRRMVDSVDQSVGRLVDTLEELGELDNTIFVFTSDNGGTAEGGAEGTRSYFAQFAPRRRPGLGGRRPARRGPDRRPRSWACTTRAAGARRPTPRSGSTRARPSPVGSGCRSSCPGRRARPAADGEPASAHQYAYVTDLTPTLLELAGIDRPDRA